MFPKVRDSLAKSEHPRQDIIDQQDIYEAETTSKLQPGLCNTAKE